MQEVRRLDRTYLPIDKFILARYFYRYGVEFIDDKEYTELKHRIEGKGLLPEYINRTWDSDPIPYTLLKKYKLKDVHDRNKLRNLKETKSIRKVNKYEDALDWLRGLPRDLDILVSLKVDGIFTNSFIEQGNLLKTESKNGELDFTYSAAKHFYKLQGIEERSIYAEAYVPRNELEDKFKTPRGMALSYMRREEPSSALHFIVFDLNTRVTSEGLFDAICMGLEVVPYQVLTVEELLTPGTLREVVAEFSDKADVQQIKADGVVLKVDDNNIYSSLKVQNQYSDGDVALIVDEFGETIYTTTVNDIICEFQGVGIGIILQVTPTVVKTGAVVKRVNAYNPKKVIDSDIRIGNTIKFKLQSNGSISLEGKVSSECN